MKPLQDNIQISRIPFCSFRIYLLCGYEWNEPSWLANARRFHFLCAVTASSADRHSNTWHFFITLSIHSTREVRLNIPILHRVETEKTGKQRELPRTSACGVGPRVEDHTALHGIVDSQSRPEHLMACVWTRTAGSSQCSFHIEEPQ